MKPCSLYPLLAWEPCPSCLDEHSTGDPPRARGCRLSSQAVFPSCQVAFHAHHHTVQSFWSPTRRLTHHTASFLAPLKPPQQHLTRRSGTSHSRLALAISMQACFVAGWLADRWPATQSSFPYCRLCPLQGPSFRVLVTRQTRVFRETGRRSRNSPTVSVLYFVQPLR